MIRNLLIAACITVGAASFASANNAGVQLFDPLLLVVNQSNHAYTMAWEDGTTDTLNDTLKFAVQNHGTVTIKPSPEKTVVTHFMTLGNDVKTPQKTNTLHFTLYDEHHHKISDNRFVHNVMLENCSMMLANIKLIIDPKGILTVVFDDRSKGIGSV